MKISFPYMGCVTGYKKLFELLGHEVVMPKKPTQKTVDLGVKYSPEFICFPFKVITGTYIECAKAGAEVIVTSGGNGPCRAGLYGELHQKILKSLGYNVNFIIFGSIFYDFRDFYNNLKRIKNGKTTIKMLKGIWFCYKLIEAMDSIEKRIKILRAYELKKGAFNRAWAEIQKMYDACSNHRDLKECNKKADEILKSIPLREVKEKDKLRFGIIGEIYIIMESSVNMDIEQTLNNMGIEVENVQYISNWVSHNIQPGFMGVSKSHEVIEKAKKFVKVNCGGHDMENIGWIVDFKERGFDAVLHLSPFGCLPELVSQSIIPSISKELQIPVLSLSLDEQMGTANNQTRIEAFVNLVQNKKANALSEYSPLHNKDCPSNLKIPEYVSQKANFSESFMH